MLTPTNPGRTASRCCTNIRHQLVHHRILPHPTTDNAGAQESVLEAEAAEPECEQDILSQTFLFSVVAHQHRYRHRHNEDGEEDEPGILLECR